MVPVTAWPDAAERAPALAGMPVSGTTRGTTMTSVRAGMTRLSSHSPKGSAIRTRGGPITNLPRRTATSG